MNDSARKIAKTISILAMSLLAVSPLYDPEVLSKLLYTSAGFGLLPNFIDEEITGTKKYIDSKNGVGLEYRGKWKNGKFHGEGIYFTLNGTYACQWKDGQKHGNCRVTKEGKVIFDGTYKNNLIDGEGIKTWPKGGTYAGQWRKGKMHGQGTITYENGNQYTGEWQEGKKHGYGQLIWTSGDTFEGQFRNNVRHGQGVYSWADGRKYIGTWEAGERHGKGTYIDSSGKQYAEVWEKGKLGSYSLK